ncbi:MotA/TolQ/ExbB proton channel family protein [Eubacterium sp.]|uniref:MotA/TolQ/ExbB proton channel family protein n=1 Tax=Eubacterium sp. TaxID=142586 RepID=UPI00258C7931|nr:MotA/TolQ/ExbB proton channel family protein [Eubacterium sp.]MCR5366936.1 MotA/TolQ/ExbB proton channel family protein [Eubacterium sp.]
MGILRINGASDSFIFAINKIRYMDKMSVSEGWVYIKQVESLFRNSYLDKLFVKYVKKVEGARQIGLDLMPDVEESINEDYLTLHCQKSFIAIIPASLTGLGILGTFYGLLSGVGDIRFSSIDVVVESITMLVRGIDTAFYTSIAGVTLSLIFEIMTKLSWNHMITTMFNFYEEFHARIIPSESSQKELIRMDLYKKILAYIERDKDEEKEDKTE